MKFYRNNQTPSNKIQTIPNIQLSKSLNIGAWILFGYCILFLVSCFPTPLFSYSIFSGAGLGEPIYNDEFSRMFSGAVSGGEIPKDLTFECSFRGEFVTTKKDNLESQTFGFTFPYFKYFLPLPKKMGVEVGLSELLNLDYEVEDSIRHLGPDSVIRSVSSKGSANSFNVGFGGKVGALSLLAGGFIVFGSGTEVWQTNFVNLSQSSYDTLQLNFEGKGGLLALGFNFGNFKFSGKYFSEANLTTATKLPARLNTSILFSSNKFKIGGVIEKWFWLGNYKETTKYSLGVEWDKLYIGGYTTNWYYGDIKEKAGCLGVRIPFASLCNLSLNCELGQRGKLYGLEETFYRLNLTLCGKEEL